MVPFKAAVVGVARRTLLQGIWRTAIDWRVRNPLMRLQTSRFDNQALLSLNALEVEDIAVALQTSARLIKQQAKAAPFKEGQQELRDLAGRLTALLTTFHEQCDQLTELSSSPRPGRLDVALPGVGVDGSGRDVLGE